MILSPADLMRIAPYVTDLHAPVFAVAGLPEEVIAVLLAKYSRSPGGLRENMAKMLAEEGDDYFPDAKSFKGSSEKARAFHEKWVLGFGHKSVGEHAILHLACEDISIVATKEIEDTRIGAGFTEKSTRYVVFDRDSFITPADLSDRHRTMYETTCRALFDTYLSLMPAVTAEVARRSPSAPEAAIRAQACDILRGLLPAGTRTNVGITINARALENMLTKLFSSPVAESNRLAAEMLSAARRVTPTLVKYAAPSPFRQAIATRKREVGGFAVMVAPAARHGVALVDCDPSALAKVAAAFDAQGDSGILPASSRIQRHAAAPTVARSMIDAVMAERGPHDAAPRCFEAASITVELTLDYGAYRDLQRHRLLSPATQRLGCLLGFEVPTVVDEIGETGAYVDVMKRAASVWDEIEGENPYAAQYVVPLGYRIRTLWTMNLREFFHVVELRSGKQGHPSYRRIAQDLYRAGVAAYPWLQGWVRVDMNDYSLARG